MEDRRQQVLQMAQETYLEGLNIVSQKLFSDERLVKELNHNLSEQYTTEIFTYLLHLVESSGNCTPIRAQFLNKLLNKDFSSDQYDELIKRLDLQGQQFDTLVPVCLKEIIRQQPDEQGVKNTKELIRIFDRLGEFSSLYASSYSPVEDMDRQIYILMLNNWLDRVNPNGIFKHQLNTHGKGCVLPQENKKEAEKDDPNLDSEKSVAELLEELNSLAGLDAVKEDVTSLINLLKIKKIRKERHMKDMDVSMHLVFTGNPGTGKTTVARLLAKLYKALGALSKGQLIEVDRSELVAGYVGQTAIKTQEVCKAALGGVLFIDEAYTLSSRKDPSDFGQEAINTLLVEMENHRDDLAVIVAGYPQLMEQFLKSNPGLKSRFNKFIQFDDYNGSQLMEIFEIHCKKNGYTLSDQAKKKAQEDFDEMYEHRDDSFANGRTVRNYFEKAMVRQANRLANEKELSDEQLVQLIAKDLSDLNDKESKEEINATSNTDEQSDLKNRG